MPFDEVMRTVRAAVSAQTVYATPVEVEGVTVIPAAVVYGGGGAGTGAPVDGGGFGVVARPVGAFVIEGRSVRWQPAVNVNAVIAAVGAVAVVLAHRWRR